MMNRLLTASALIAGLLLGGLAVSTDASAKIVELGRVRSAPIVAPTCPSGASASNCSIVLERTTALQTVTNGVIGATKVKRAGWIVAFTVGLSNLSSDAKTELSYIHGLDVSYGGTPQIALTVLKPGKHNKYTVVAQSGTYHLIPFLGQVLQQPMALPPTFSAFTALPVKPGEVVGVTVPTWAPILAYNLTATKYSYRQSRNSDCTNATKIQTAQTAVGASVKYGCEYPGTRVEYSATEVVNQPYPKTYVGAPPAKKKKHHH